jgi:hypothetical protein
MGLHNPNDWRYRQKPGNLFNTYLGKAPPPDPPETRRPSSNRRRPVRLSTPVPKERDAAEALVEFLQYNASVGEANRFLRLVGTHKGLIIKPSKQPWSAINDFARTHLTSGESARYLTELRRRKAAGEPLIRAHRLR